MEFLLLFFTQMQVYELNWNKGNTMNILVTIFIKASVLVSK